MEEKELWRNVLLRLSPTIRREHFITWFQNTAVLQIHNGTIVVGTPTQFAHDWIANRYKLKIFQAAAEYRPQLKEVNFVVDSSLSDPSDPRPVLLSSLPSESGQVEKKVRKLPNKEEVKIGDSGVSVTLNQKYTLGNFIVGKDNRLVHAACLAVSTNPGGQWNPLFIYGGVGLGKTHLLQGTGIEILRNFPKKIVVYLTAEKFLNEVVDAIKRYNAQDFKARYRHVDCLIIDDIQLLADKDRTQEEFFHTFNELYHGNKQIIISSDRPPKELSGFEERLISRFQMGMVAEVYLPDFETRLAILQRKTQDQGVLLPPEVLEFIASNVHGSIRELEGVLKQAIAQARLTQATPTIRSLAEFVKKLNGKQEMVGISAKDLEQNLRVRTPDDLIDLVARYYRIPRSDVVGAPRKREVMIPRQMAMFLIHEVLGYSLDSIGDSFGGRTHTTVLHACQKVKHLLEKDQKIVQDMHALKQDMGL